MEKRNPHRITIKLTERELEILFIIKEKEGQPNLPAVIHSCIRSHFNDTYYTKYKDGGSIRPIKESEIELTPEQKCESIGCTVAKKNGVLMCFYKGTGGELDWWWDLNDMDRGIKQWQKLYG